MAETDANCASFLLRRWKKSGRDEWSCALHGRIVSLRQDPRYLHYRAVYPVLRARRDVKVEKVEKVAGQLNVKREGKAKAKAKAKAKDGSQRSVHVKREIKREKGLAAVMPTPPSSSPSSDGELRERRGAVGIKQEVEADTFIDNGDSLSNYDRHYNNNNNDDDDDDTTALVKHYLNLEPNLEALYQQWAAADENFKRRAPRFTGVRILRQDSWEALVGFICSSNNNIARISQMVDKLCTHYGTLVGFLEHKTDDDDGEVGVSRGSNSVDYDEEDVIDAQRTSATPYYDFPSPEVLARPGVEQHLRELGFGYRAKYLHQTAIMVAEKGLDWLDGLRNPESPAFGTRRVKSEFGGATGRGAGEMMDDGGGREGYRRAHESLLALQGVGPKVADCVCLMGLGWGEAVPVDTHGMFFFSYLYSLFCRLF